MRNLLAAAQPQCHQAKSASPPVAERNTKPITTNYNCARREPGPPWPRGALKFTGSQLADARSKVSSRSTRPSRPTSFRAHNHEWKRATGVRNTSSNAGRRARVLSFVPAGSAPLRAPGRVSSYRTSLSAALSLPSRATEAPPVRKRAALSDLLGYRTSFAREGQHPKVSATRKLYDAPLTRPRRLRGATEARCAGAPYGQSAGQHSSPYGHLADSAASTTPPPTATSAAPLPAPRSAPAPGAGSAPSRPGPRSHPKEGRASVALFTRLALASSLGRASQREKRDPCLGPKGA